jgi:hypothetical protein
MMRAGSFPHDLPMQSTTLLLGLTCLALSSSAALCADDEGQAFRLTHKAHEKWDYVLPAERWRPVGEKLELPGGLSFVTELDGPLKLRIDTNGDGRVDEDVRGQEGFVTLRGVIDGETVKYSVRLRNSGAGKWDWTSGSSMSGAVAGQTVHVFDQDGNGRFDDYGVDAIALGNSKNASLLSTVVPIDGRLQRFAIDEDGSQARVAPYTGPTGTLEVTSAFESKGKLTSAVFRSGDMSFEVSGSSKGVELPAGRYDFVAGRVSKGSSRASMRRGRMGSVEVVAGEATRLEWGAEVVGDFSFKQTGDQVTVQADFGFFGTAGEEYYDFFPRGKGPAIVIKDAQRGKQLREGRFPES